MSSHKKIASRKTPSTPNPAVKEPSFVRLVGVEARKGGPRTPAGKARASRNSFKLGLFARAFVLSGRDRRAFDNLRSKLRKSSERLELVFELFVASAWRVRLALRCEQAMAEKLVATDRGDGRTPVDNGSPMVSPYSLTSSDVRRRRLKLLETFSNTIVERGCIPAEFERPMTEAFGADFWKTLAEWAPTNSALVRLTQALLEKSRIFGMELPVALSVAPTPDEARKYAELDSGARTQMVRKLVELQKQQLLRARCHVGEAQQDGTMREANHDRLDLSVRYVTSALRDFCRLLREYEERRKTTKK